jgi:shikimate dehydrogenase
MLRRLTKLTSSYIVRKDADHYRLDRDKDKSPRRVVVVSAHYPAIRPDGAREGNRVANEPAAVRELLGSIAERHRATVGHRARSVLIGLLGRGIASSRSPQMHEREGERLGLRYTYALVDFDLHGLSDDALGVVIAEAAELGFAGLNVTHPFKQAIVAHLTDLAPDAAAIGAVNTVVFEGRRRIGHNTDCWGFAESMRQGLAGESLEAVVQFGAGGGGAAVAHALLELGAANLDIYDPEVSRATGLADRLTERFGRQVIAVTDPLAAVHRASGTVNATPVGMEKYPGTPFDASALERRHWVADIVYFPADTALLQAARARGCRTLAGTGMAIFQAIKAFELFTGLTPDRDAMAQHFEAAA